MLAPGFQTSSLQDWEKEMPIVYKVPSLEFCYSSLNGLQALPALKPGPPAMLGDSSPGALGLSGLWVFAATEPLP